MLRCLSILSSSIVLSGCLSSNVLLTVRADGSGTINQVTTVRTAAMAEAARLVPGAGPVPRIEPRAPGTAASDMEGWQTSPSNDPDIFLATLTKRDGKLVVGTPVNITHSPGYDNQPSFTRDGRGVLFSSVRGASAAPAAAAPSAGRAAAPPTDIYRYDIDTQSIARVTNTPEAEYSPTVTPDGLHISVVRVEADSTQRLWAFGLNGKDPALVLTDIKPVGYHAWIDANTVALFVLGQPATLQIADVRTGKADIVAQGIGRSVLRTPSGAVSFVRQQRTAPDIPPTYTIDQVVPSKQPGSAAPSSTVLVEPVPGSGDPNLAWTSDGTLLMAHEGRLYSWRQGDRDWTPAADLAALGLSGVTRLAVSPRGDRIAIVAVPR